MRRAAMELAAIPGAKSFFVAMLFDRAGMLDEAFVHLRKAAGSARPRHDVSGRASVFGGYAAGDATNVT